MHHSFFILLSTVGLLGWFQVLAIVNGAAVNSRAELGEVKGKGRVALNLIKDEQRVSV